jgi:hypothetical protein
MAAARKPTAPAGLNCRVAGLWQQVTAEYQLSEHERLQLGQACETADIIDRLRARERKEGDVVDSPHGAKTRPALVELHQQRIVLARLLAALKLPAGLETPDAKPRQHRERAGSTSWVSADASLD